MAEHSIQFIIDAQNKTKEVFKTVESDLKGVSDKMKSMQDTFKKMATVGLASATAIGIGIKKFGEKGAEFTSVQTDYNRMVKSIDADGDVLLEKLNEVSGGTVANTDLMLSTNKAMALGVGGSMEDITKLMEIARVRGRALGLDTTQAFNDIVTGIGRSSPLILDNLGIITKGWADEAEAQGVAMNSQFIMNKVLADGTKELEEMGEIVLSDSEKLQQMKKRTADLSSTIGVAFLPAINRVLEIITPLIEKFANWIAENDKLFPVLVIVAGAIAGIVGVLGTLGLVLPPIIASITFLKGVFTLLNLKIIIIVAAIGALVYAGILLYKNWDKVSAFFIDIWDKMVYAVKSAINFMIDLVESYVNVWIDGINLIIRALNKIQVHMPDWLGGKSFGINISEVAKADFGRLGIDKLDEEVPSTLATSSGTVGQYNVVNINGGTYLDENVSEDIGNKIIEKLKLSMKI